MTEVETVTRLEGLLNELGYGHDLTERQFPVWVGDRVVPLDLVGFAAPAPRDMTTATIAVTLSGTEKSFRDALLGARALAAPALLLASEVGIAVWSVGTDSEEQSHALGWDGWANAGRLAEDLSPARLWHSKQTGRQLGLFPVDAGLLHTTRRHAMESLASRIGDGVTDARKTLKGADPDRVARLVVGAVTALMVRDKLGSDTPTMEVIALARARFPAYFTWLTDLSTDESAVFDSLLRDLGRDVNYRGLDPFLVSDVYEHALLDATARKRLSIFYTPPEVAKALVAAAPVELVAPEERTVLDLACGSGTLLVAAHDRLRAAAPPKYDFQRTHEYLTEHLFGFDADPFAVEIAKLSLLLTALPIGNSWHIERRTVEEGLPDDLPPIRFVLSNPPWSSEWQKPVTGGNETNKRIQLAERFVRASVEAVCDEGYVALLLPATIFEARSSRAIREWLDNRVAVLEVTRLPENTFRNSRVETAAVVLQKTAERKLFAFRRAAKRPDWRERVFEDGAMDVNLGVASSRAITSGLLAHGPLTARADLPSLSTVALVQGGAVPTPGFSPDVRARGEFLYLPKAGSMPFMADVSPEECEPTTYPEGFNWRGSDPGHFRQPKVLVSGVFTPSNPWRLRVRLDRLGIIPRQSLHIVEPLDERTTLEALAAYLASAPVAVFVDQHNVSRSIRLSTLRDLPVPSDDATWNKLGAIGSQLAEGAALGKPPQVELVRHLDDVVMDAWRLTKPERSGVRELLGGFNAPEGLPRYAPPVRRPPRDQPSSATTPASGAVLAATAETVTVWIAGITGPEGEAIPIPDRFPGALLQTGATFEALVTNGDIANATYRFQRQAWKGDDELFSPRRQS